MKKRYRVEGCAWGRWRHYVDDVFEVEFEEDEEDPQDYLYDMIRDSRKEEAEFDCTDSDFKITEIKE